MAAAANDPKLGRRILDRFDEWIGIVQEALHRSVVTQPVLATVPTREAAYAISAKFLGIELLTRLDPERSEAESVFTMMAGVAQLIETLGTTLFPTPPAR